MKNVIRNVIILATLNASAFAQAVLPTHFSGSFSVPEWLYLSPLEHRVDNPDFPNGVYSSFSFTVNVPQQGTFENQAIALDSWTPDPFPIGTTNLTRSDIGAYVSFQDGILQFFMIGGLLDGVNGVGGYGAGSGPSDFMFVYAPLQNAAVFLYQVDGEFAQVEGENIQARVDISTAQPVPEASSIGIGGALVLLGLIVRSQVTRRTT